MLEGYPKEETLRDGSKVVLRPMEKDDFQCLFDFFQQLPLEDRMFLKDDVTNPEVIRRWCKELNFDRVLPILGMVGEKCVGNASLHFSPHGWQRHVGEIRVVVSPGFQRKGLGTLLAHEVFHVALLKGLRKILAMMMEDQEGAVKAFARLGFKKEAVISDGVMDMQAKTHNLLIMSSDVESLWRKIHDMVEEMEFRKIHLVS